MLNHQIIYVNLRHLWFRLQHLQRFVHALRLPADNVCNRCAISTSKAVFLRLERPWF